MTSTRGCTRAAEVVSNVQSLIGFFDLDPNRVLDLVLEALEAVPSRVAHKALVDLFNPNYLPHVLGFKQQAQTAVAPHRTLAHLGAPTDHSTTAQGALDHHHHEHNRPEHVAHLG